MNWNQKKVIQISEMKVVADLFRVGCNWEVRRKKLAIIEGEKAKKLHDNIERRLDRIFEFVKYDCCGGAVMVPDWYHKRNMKPFSDELIKIISK